MSEQAASPVTQLTDEQAWATLTGSKVGRLVTSVDGEPEIYPVNYLTDGRSIVLRTAEGNKLFTVAINHRVAFEIDGWDAAGGWSVIVRGSAEVVRGDEEIARLETLGLNPWVSTVKNYWVRIVPTEVSGRTFRFGGDEQRVDEPA